ncbi:MAG: hypothetical protein JOZ80_04740, partial [Acidobacteriaceae bacterium]|nr:hypothetical protein [Acidobacteriaceae bacterium]
MKSLTYSCARRFRATAAFVMPHILTVSCMCLLLPTLAAQVEMTTQHNDLNRTGQNLSETTLNTSNVKVNTFGKLFSLAVDGQIYAQPLYMPNLTIGGVTRNVVFVATQNNSLYAFDADNPSAPTLWHQNFGTPVPSSDTRTGCSDIYPQSGITSTPVIDTGSKTIYVVAKTKDTSNSTYHFKLHALDLISGAEKFGGPVEITGSVKGSGWNTSGGNVSFSALTQANRPGLLLMNGAVYVAFGGMCEYLWHGWLFGYNASNLLSTPSIYNTTPNGKEGGIWGGGQGLIGQNDFIYFMTGNGTFDANNSGSDYGETFMKIDTASGLSVSDWFTPDDVITLNNEDADIGSGGPMALPNTNLIVGMGKDGILRLVNTENMGHYNSGANADVQEFVATTGVFMGSPIYWNSPNHGPMVYLWGGGDYLKAYEFNGSTFATSPATQSGMTTPSGYSNSSPLSISSNGAQAGTGILWAASPYSGNANHSIVPGILRAFDATNLSTELWDSQMNAARDGVGNYAKFSPPTIANGKVYLASFSYQLLVYGLLGGSGGSNGMMQLNTGPSAIQASAPSVSVAFTNAQTAGDLNVVAVGWGDNTSAVSSVTDTKGNTYVRAVGPSSISGLQHSIYYAKNIAGGSNTVTVKFNEAAAYPDVRILEYSG